MNWKQILYKGLPVFLIAAVIVVVTAIVSRPKPQPIVTNANDSVVNFKGLDVTKGDLYNMLKQSTGLSTLIDTVDRSLLTADYADKIDTTALDAAIESDKTSQGIDQFYQNMVMLGVISSKDDPDADANIKNYYMLSYLQKAYATNQAITDLEANESTTGDIADAKANFHEDMCIITLKYDSQTEANQIATQLSAAQDPLAFFKTQYASQHETTTPTTTTEPDFVNGDFTCNYDTAIYTSYASTSTFRDFIFADTYKYTNPSTQVTSNEEFAIGDYNKTPKYVSADTTYYFVYKLSKPDYKEGYRDTADFTNYIENKLVSSTVTSTYIKNELVDLHNSTDVNLKIYDSTIGSQYKSGYDSAFTTEKKLNSDKHIVASYKLNGVTTNIKADDLYTSMSTRYGVQLLINKINYSALTTIPGIQMTKAEMQNLKDEIASYKTQYLQKQETYTWPDFMALNYGAFSEAELANILAGPTLTERYILGYHTDTQDFTGVNEITQADIDAAYDAWFSITASHVLFTYDGPTDTAGLAVAKDKADQIINGCTNTTTDTNGNSVVTYRKDLEGNTITADTCYIKYTDPADTSLTNVPFPGLDEIKASDYASVFAALAVAYSDDPSAASNSGSLGAFGPGAMVPEFQAAAQEIASRIQDGGVPFSLAPVLSEIPNADGSITYGVHVIYVTDIAAKTAKPTDMDVYNAYEADLKNTDIVITDKYTTAQITAFNAYDTFVATLKTTLETTLKGTANENQQLALLRDSLNFSFADTNLQAIYANVNALQETDTTK